MVIDIISEDWEKPQEIAAILSASGIGGFEIKTFEIKEGKILYHYTIMQR